MVRTGWFSPWIRVATASATLSTTSGVGTQRLKGVWL